MKNIKLSAILCIVMLFFLINPAYASISVYVNDEFVRFDVKPVIESGRVLVPVRAVFQALGAKVTWDSKSQTAVSIKDDMKIKIRVNDERAEVNEKIVKLDVPARNIKGRVMVPLRFIGESFGMRVNWHSRPSIISISKDNLMVDNLQELIGSQKNLVFDSFFLLPNRDMWVISLEGNSGPEPKYVIQYFDSVNKNIINVGTMDYGFSQTRNQSLLLPDGRLILKEEDDIQKTTVYVADYKNSIQKKYYVDVPSEYLQFSSKGEGIFSKQIGTETNIFKYSLDGKLTNITNTLGKEDVEFSVASPDGSKICFMSFPNVSGGYPHLSIVNSDGTSRIDFDYRLGFSVSPVWSPNGKLLAYDMHETESDNGIWIVKADGQSKQKILSGEFRDIRWSPDGTRIYAKNNKGYIVVNIDGSNLMQFIDITPMTWSPDDNQLLFKKNGSLWSYNFINESTKKVECFFGDDQMIWSNNQDLLYILGPDYIWKGTLS